MADEYGKINYAVYPKPIEYYGIDNFSMTSSGK